MGKYDFILSSKAFGPVFEKCPSRGKFFKIWSNYSENLGLNSRKLLGINAIEKGKAIANVYQVGRRRGIFANTFKRRIGAL